MPIPNYKDIIDLLKTGLTVEAQEKIMELRVAALGLEEENVVLKRENADLKVRLEHKGRVTHNPPFFHLEGEVEKPLCPKCWQGDERITYVISQSWQGSLRYDCPVCKFGVLPDVVQSGRVRKVR